jgi:hypothetical protein
MANQVNNRHLILEAVFIWMLGNTQPELLLMNLPLVKTHSVWAMEDLLQVVYKINRWTIQLLSQARTQTKNKWSLHNCAVEVRLYRIDLRLSQPIPIPSLFKVDKPKLSRILLRLKVNKWLHHNQSTIL